MYRFVLSILCHWNKNSKPASNPACRCASPALIVKLDLVNQNVTHQISLHRLLLSTSERRLLSKWGHSIDLHRSPCVSSVESCSATGSIFICMLLQLTCIYIYLRIIIYISINRILHHHASLIKHTHTNHLCKDPSFQQSGTVIGQNAVKGI